MTKLINTILIALTVVAAIEGMKSINLMNSVVQQAVAKDVR